MPRKRNEDYSISIFAWMGFPCFSTLKVRKLLLRMLVDKNRKPRLVNPQIKRRRRKTIQIRTTKITLLPSKRETLKARRFRKQRPKNCFLFFFNIYMRLRRDLSLMFLDKLIYKPYDDRMPAWIDRMPSLRDLANKIIFVFCVSISRASDIAHSAASTLVLWIFFF